MNLSPQRRFGAITPQQSRELDAAALELGIATETLMEAAGLQVARLAWRMLRRRARAVHVVAGHGNNGGDALVAARWLAGWGCSVSVAVVAARERLDTVRAAQCASAGAAGAHVTVSDSAHAATPPHGAVLVIDGLLGTGLTQAPREVAAAVIGAMGEHILSIDVPSGLDAATGSAPGAAVVATATCALAACKRGFWEPGVDRRLGALYVADIGVPDAAWLRCGLQPPAAVRAGALQRVPAMPARAQAGGI